MIEKNDPIMELHPLCTYFPRMSEAEFISLKDNLQDNGQIHPIYTLDGMILDGGNRYRALCELGIIPVIIEYTGANPAQFILSTNLHRRHLTQGQSAAIVSASQSWINAQADSQLSSTAQLDTAISRAKQSGVGHRTQQLADKLVKEAPAELVKEVLDGKKSLNKAIKEITPAKPVIVKPDPVPVIVQETQTSQQTASNKDKELSHIIDEQLSVIEALEADKTTWLNVIDSDDRLAASFDEVKKLTEANRLLKVRIDELATEKDEAFKAAEYWKSQYFELEESLNKDSDN
jgi:hypothetical protein